jgi:hypothetical protein
VETPQPPGLERSDTRLRGVMPWAPACRLVPTPQLRRPSEGSAPAMRGHGDPACVAVLVAARVTAALPWALAVAQVEENRKERRGQSRSETDCDD